ncbi:class I SAM-dependent methyltransferase [Kineococcus indalonis]|uniref:class I SAM-dependent methyltransferase n=1 Tax=Kineococcus indalonis TaxID=2696566 RepID=UPI001412806F|nr:class I SAM-dependent methyltransferase [Kineococcus indalonis]NAZ87149.1 methyltransferase domain-containing protein [Kineococcus indalonis]
MDRSDIDPRGVDPSNHAQADAWDGAEGRYWAAHHRRFDAVLADHQPAFAAACGLGPDDDVLDIGCGTGATTLAAARTAERGTALGVDLSSPMLQVARSLARQQGVGNARFERADAQVHPFAPAGFDAAISRTGAMFFGDPDQAFANIRRALRPGGRLTLLTWQPSERNPWFAAFTGALLGTVPAPPPGSPGPFSMSEPERVSRLLARAGFCDVEVTGLARPATYGATVEDAHDFLLGLLGWMLQQRRPAERPRAAQALRETLAEHAGARGVQFDSATWIVSARRG